MSPRGKKILLALLIITFAAVLLPLWAPYRPPAKNASTRALISNIATACEAYEYDFKYYPPDSVTVGSQTYTGSRSLVYHLTTAFRIKPVTSRGEVKANGDYGPYFNLHPKHQRNRDGIVTLLDTWGREIYYDNASDGFTPYGPDDPRTYEAPLNTLRNPKSFDLFSLGAPTSDPATRRPITNWEK
jgi:hypothetical protein